MLQASPHSRNHPRTFTNSIEGIRDDNFDFADV